MLAFDFLPHEQGADMIQRRNCLVEVMRIFMGEVGLSAGSHQLAVNGG